MGRTVLFLCTGNYYRSRFAEQVFNAGACGMDWCARSRGLDLEKGKDNVGPMSTVALASLRERGIPLSRPLRHPAQVTRQDFALAARVIAADRTEHEPYMYKYFSEFLPLTTYWHIKDVAPGPEYNPLDEIYAQVQLLLQHLKEEMGRGR